MRAAVTGGTGFVGSHLVDALLERGDRVQAQVRDPRKAADLARRGVALVEGDLDDEAALARAFDGAEVVFHVAGLIKALEPGEYFRVNAGGTERALTAARRVGARRMVLVSSQAAGGPGWRDRPRREEDPPAPVSPYGASKLAAERIALGATDGPEVAVVRPCVVYGPRDQALRPLFKLCALGVAPRLPANPAVSLIHARDLARLMLLAGDAPRASGRVYFGCGPAAGVDELIGLIGAGMARKPIRIPAPAVALVAAGIGADVLSSLTRTPRPFGRQKALEMLRTSWWCSGERAERELGFRAAIDHAEGLADTARWYRAAGWI